MGMMLEVQDEPDEEEREDDETVACPYEEV
jgi:hypothetical protein